MSSKWRPPDHSHPDVLTFDFWTLRLCGPLPEDIEERIHRLSIEQLATLGEALLEFRSLQDLESWLAVNDSAGR